MSKQEDTSQIKNGAEATECSKCRHSELKFNSLQIRYMSLLEERIKVLESQLKPAKNDSDLEDEVEGGNKKSEEKKEEESIQPRIEYRESKYKADGERKETVIGQNLTNNDSSEPASLQVPVTFLKYYDRTGEYQNSTITSREPNLNAVVLFVFAHHPFFKHYRDTWPSSFSSPYEPFIHSWSELQNVAQQKEDSSSFIELRKQISSEENPTSQYSTIKDFKDPEKLTLALDYLKQILRYIEQTPELEDYFKNRRELGSDPVASIAWDELWTLFPPGELIITRQCLKQPQLLIVQEASADNKEQREQDNKEVWLLYAWTYDWDGKQYCRAMVTVKFERFKTKNQIDSLDCYPLRYDPNSVYVMDFLCKRGKKFCDFLERSSRVFEYSGAAQLRGGGFSFQKERSSDTPFNTVGEPEARPRSRNVSALLG